MASSRNRPPKPDPADTALLAALQRAVEQALPSIDRAAAPRRAALRSKVRLAPASRSRAAAAGATAPAPAPPPLLLAYSGGPDSTVLLDLACRLRDSGVAAFAGLRAVHVHHGLQDQADDWAQHCRTQCAQRGVDCAVASVQVARGRGIEDGARTARYGALLQQAVQAGAAAVLTAHHADDRLETFLLQWLRGAGPAGLAGIAEQRRLQAATAGAAVPVLRPLLDVPRSQILAYIERHGLAVVEDPSNADPRFARNALRLHVLPALAQIRSGYRKSAVRSIELVGEAAEVLQELAAEGLQACTDGAPDGMLRLDRLAALPAVRRALVLRAWLARAGIEAPSRARLSQVLEQALGGGREGRMLVRVAGQELRRHGGLLCLRQPQHGASTREQLHWHGEAQLAVGAWGGVLRFLPAEGPGFDADWLRARPLEIRARSGGERFKPHPTRPSKRLKHLYQEAGVPEFERRVLPLLWRDDRLIYVARIGADARLVETGPGRVRIEWQGAATLLPE